VGLKLLKFGNLLVSYLVDLPVSQSVKLCLVFAVEPEDHADYIRTHQYISTIETTSPSRSLLQQGLPAAPVGATGYPGYCTLRNGMPLQDLNNIGSKPKMVRTKWLPSWLSGISSSFYGTRNLIPIFKKPDTGRHIEPV
jgi:hypothetical protein